MIRALCPMCALPRATVSMIRVGHHDVSLVTCECVTRNCYWNLGGMRAIPMTENHDPGDEDATP